VGKIFIIQTAVTAMTDNAAYFPMSIFEKIRILEEYLFPNLQRREFTASALAASFTSLLFFNRGCLLKHFFIGMTDNA
jgi:hypothetical protein